MSVNELLPNESVFNDTVKVTINSNISYYTRVLFKATVTPREGAVHSATCQDYVENDNDILDIKLGDGTDFIESSRKSKAGETVFYKLIPTRDPNGEHFQSFNLKIRVKEWVGERFCEYYMHADLAINLRIEILQADYLDGNLAHDFTQADDADDAWKEVFKTSTKFVDFNGVTVGEYINEDTEIVVPTASTKSIEVDGETLYFQGWIKNNEYGKVYVPGETISMDDDGAQYTQLYAPDASYPDLSFTYNSSTGEWLLVGANSSATSISIPAFRQGDEVTVINNRAFYNYTSLQTVDAPATITKIGDYAFSGCTNLRDIEIPESVTSIGQYAFQNCTSLTSLDLPDGTRSIGNNAFYGCTNLTEVDVPESVVTLGEYAFYNCTKLAEVNIPDGVKTIGNRTFYNCSSLTSVDMSDNITSIGEYAFYNCRNLTNIEIPNKVTSIRNRAFQDCTSLTSIEIPDSVTLIETEAFNRCRGLTSVTIGNGVKVINRMTFCQCSNLESVTIGNKVTSIGSSAFDSCASLTSVNIPNSVTTIGSRAFQSCTSLKSIEIPNSVTTIEQRAFGWCSSLESVSIPNSVTTIGSSAFHDCTSLTSVIIPDSVTTIGSSAFSECSRLTSVTFNAPNGWYAASSASATSGTNLDLSDTAQNATYLKTTYRAYYWKKN